LTYDKNTGINSVLTANQIIALFDTEDTSMTRCPIVSFDIVYNSFGREMVESGDTLYDRLVMDTRVNAMDGIQI
jgi:hypothetical protein